MNRLRLLGIVMLSTLVLIIGGCGNGGGDRRGDMTVTVAKSDNGNNTSNVTFNVSYTNSSVTDYEGLDVSVTAAIDGVVISGDPHTEIFSTSGKFSLTYTGIPAGSTISFSAKTGDIVASTSTYIASTTLGVAPATLPFPVGAAAGSRLTTTILGGSSPYSAGSSTADISASISGSTLTVTIVTPNTTGTAKTATITVTDSLAKTATVTVTY